MTTYNLTPGQYRILLERLGREYEAVNDLVHYAGGYSKTYIHRADEERSGAFSEKDAEATVKEYQGFNKRGFPTGKVEEVILTTEDPKIKEELEKMGVKSSKPRKIVPSKGESIDSFMRRLGKAAMRDPVFRKRIERFREMEPAKQRAYLDGLINSMKRFDLPVTKRKGKKKAFT